MKLLLANYGKFGTDLHFPLSLAYIAGALQRQGCDFDLLDCYVHPYEEQKKVLFETLKSGDYGAVGFSVFLGNYSYRDFKALTRELKEEFPTLKIIVGGPMATCIPEMILQHMDADIVVIGEGELTAPELMKALDNGQDLSTVNGIGFRQNGQTVINPPPSRIKDLDVLHPLPYELFPMQFYLDYLEKTGRCFGVLGTRGCFSKCSFCFLTYGKRMTFRSVDSIAEEMQYLHGTYGVSTFNFLDDNFVNMPKFGRKLCSMIRGLDFEVQWRFQGRVDKMDDELIREFASTGMCGVTLGLESGSQKILDAVNKGITVEQQERAVKLCQKYNIPFSANFIIGFPDETDETIEETKDFLTRNRITQNVWINFIICYPKTPVYEYALSKGIIVDEDEYLSNLGPLGDKPYVNISRWSTDELIKKRDYLMAGIEEMRAAR